MHRLLVLSEMQEEPLKASKRQIYSTVPEYKDLEERFHILFQTRLKLFSKPGQTIENGSTVADTIKRLTSQIDDLKQQIQVLGQQLDQEGYLYMIN